jgi:two-component system response regulator ResD
VKEEVPARQEQQSVQGNEQTALALSDVDGEQKNNVLRFPDLTINLPARRVLVKGQEIALTPTEFDLLALFAQSPDRVFTREVLMNKVWGYDYMGDGHTIDVHISALRKKIETDPEQRYIKTVWRVGYRFEAKARMSASS